MLKKTMMALLLMGAASVALAGSSVDINAATAEELAEALTGVGEVRAAAIVEHREANGPFASVDALVEVDGIGPATLEANRDRIDTGAE